MTVNNFLTDHLLSFLQDEEDGNLNSDLISFYTESFNLILEDYAKANFDINIEEILILNYIQDKYNIFNKISLNFIHSRYDWLVFGVIKKYLDKNQVAKGLLEQQITTRSMAYDKLFNFRQ